MLGKSFFRYYNKNERIWHERTVCQRDADVKIPNSCKISAVLSNSALTSYRDSGATQIMRKCRDAVVVFCAPIERAALAFALPSKPSHTSQYIHNLQNDPDIPCRYTLPKYRIFKSNLIFPEHVQCLDCLVQPIKHFIDSFIVRLLTREVHSYLTSRAGIRVTYKGSLIIVACMAIVVILDGELGDIKQSNGTSSALHLQILFPRGPLVHPIKHSAPLVLLMMIDHVVLLIFHLHSVPSQEATGVQSEFPKCVC